MRKTPIENNIDVISVKSLAFKRFLECKRITTANSCYYRQRRNYEENHKKYGLWECRLYYDFLMIMRNSKLLNLKLLINKDKLIYFCKSIGIDVLNTTPLKRLLVIWNLVIIKLNGL